MEGGRWITTKDFLIIFASGLALVFFALPYYKSLSLDDSSRVTMVFQFIPVFYLLLAYLFLGESLQQKSLKSRLFQILQWRNPCESRLL
ncbi:hypothetical protein COT49_02895 [candidate division WWE3 bacterium CG08_land_8_20_14_0_20_40_13]|uniref:EamA domain-containing protein n=1 Tax=candidate division WWE3 bacterium CG08_land_8_20_14_0_20_40_13 TaxID=1975084 RepID=A0A2H0XDA2_UNCKA|nr:MAG: hypothetical protein COT49_02895 [candidate division WWE3 bacterium CG08_land_8_20_14_0_20_40_13]